MAKPIMLVFALHLRLVIYLVPDFYYDFHFTHGTSPAANKDCPVSSISHVVQPAQDIQLHARFAHTVYKVCN